MCGCSHDESPTSWGVDSTRVNSHMGLKGATVSYHNFGAHVYTIELHGGFGVKGAQQRLTCSSSCGCLSFDSQVIRSYVQEVTIEPLSSLRETPSMDLLNRIECWLALLRQRM